MVDVSRIKASLNKLSNPGGGGGGDRPNNLVKLPVGDHTLRIVPYKYDMENPFLELHFHYGIGGKSFLCPKEMDGEYCPICEYGWELYNEFKETGLESLKNEFKSVMPKMRVYVPVIVKESEDKNIVFDYESNNTAKFWGVSKQAYEQLLNEVIIADKEGIDITSPSAGLDISVKMEPFQMRKDRFVVKSINAARRESPLVEDSDQIESIIDSCININDIFKPSNTSELKEALSRHAHPTAEVDTNSDTSVGTQKDYGSSTNEGKSSDVDDRINKAFDDDGLPF